jgi:type IV pilus assembly protein PilO
MKKPNFQELLDELKNIDLNDPGKWSPVVRTATVLILCAIVSGAGYYFFAWSAKRPVLIETQVKEDALWKEFEEKSHKAANLQAYKDQLREMEKSFGAMLGQLPSRTEVPNLLVDISQAGVGAGLEEKLFQPDKEQQKDFYAELPIQIRLTGGYHEMGRFVSAVAALPRIVTLHDIEIAPAPKGTGDSLVLNVTAKTYRYLDDEEQAALEKKLKEKAKKSKKKKGAAPAAKEGEA